MTDDNIYYATNYAINKAVNDATDSYFIVDNLNIDLLQNIRSEALQEALNTVLSIRNTVYENAKMVAKKVADTTAFDEQHISEQQVRKQIINSVYDEVFVIALMAVKNVVSQSQYSNIIKNTRATSTKSQKKMQELLKSTHIAAQSVIVRRIAEEKVLQDAEKVAQDLARIAAERSAHDKTKQELSEIVQRVSKKVAESIASMIAYSAVKNAAKNTRTEGYVSKDGVYNGIHYGVYSISYKSALNSAYGIINSIIKNSIHEQYNTAYQLAYQVLYNAAIISKDNTLSIDQINYAYNLLYNALLNAVRER